MNATATQTVPAAPGRAQSNYSYAIGYLRSSIVALVVAHHAALAYCPFTTPIPASLLGPSFAWRAWPVVDSHRAEWLGVMVGVNDVFFMALMFFVSGLFVWRSLSRKGAAAYMRDRWLRLGLPFLPLAFIFAPLTYYPTWLQMPGHGAFATYLVQFFALGHWSAGPVWFCWVLLVFDRIAVALFRHDPEWGAWVGRLAANAGRQPAIFFAGLVVVTAVLYVPLALLFTPGFWVALGPFSLQICRVLLYFAYFAAGIVVGAQGLDRGLLAATGNLARRWPLWIATAVCAYFAFQRVGTQVYSHPFPHTIAAARSLPVMSWLLLFAVSCAATSFAVMALFVRFAKRQMRFLDSLAANSYGIFLIHYILVSWLGYAMLPAPLPATGKFLIVFTGSVGLSWMVTAQLRRFPAVARVI